MRGRAPASSALLLAVLLLAALPAAARPPAARSIPIAAAVRGAGNPRPAAVANIDVARRMDLNHLNMFLTNEGSFAYDVANLAGYGGEGLFYPRGSGKTAMFAGGLWVGAQVGGQTRVTVAEYSQEYRPGPMAAHTYTLDQPRYVTYKVRPPSGDPQDTTHVDRSPAELTADPTLDPVLHHSWSEYIKGAVPDGAPTRVWRLPNTATPDPTDSVDVIGPDVTGDEMTWAVYNDADPTRHTNEAGTSPPLGIEVQQTTYAFNRGDALGDAIFISYKIINKGTDVLQNAYLSAWSDPDLGQFTDDLNGCSVSRKLGFCYNGQPSDAIYGAAPPAIGIALLRGPKVNGTPLGMTAFTRYVNGTDPQTFIASYNYMQGLNPDGTPIIDPTTSLPTRYAVNGDPLAGTGWLDSNPADRRMQLSSGPFTMAPGDTQTFVVAVICAQGTDRLASIGSLECETDAVRAAWTSGFTSFPAVSNCPAVRACPEPASFWASQCPGGGSQLSNAQMTAIAQCIAPQETTFTWPAGQELAKFCATLNPPGGGDLRQQATREFATLLANVCAGQQRLSTAAAESISLNPLLAISCPGLPAHAISDLLLRAHLHKALQSAVYLDNNPVHPPGIVGVNLGLAQFGGGADAAANFIGSTLDPVAMADSFNTVELRFSHTITQKAYRYLRLERASDGAAPPQGRAYLYGGFRTVPLSAWDTDQNQQLEVGFVERTFTDDFGTILPPAQQPATFDSTWGPSADFDGGREYLFVFRRPYGGVPQSLFTTDGVILGSAPALFALVAALASPSAVIDDGDAFRFNWGSAPSPGLDSMFVALASKPLSDPAVQAAYSTIIGCLQPINNGLGLSGSCNQPTPTLISLASADAEPDQVSLEWSSTSGAQAVSVERNDGADVWTTLGIATFDGAGRARFVDRGVTAGRRYGYRLAIGAGSGITYAGETWVDVPAAVALALQGLRPNPAHGDLFVSFSLPARAPAQLEILDVAGRRVFMREVGGLGPGRHVVALDEARPLPAGVYLMRLTQRGRTASAKAAVVR